MSTITDLQHIFDSIHNVNSTATMPREFEYQEDEQKETMFDRLVLRWF